MHESTSGELIRPVPSKESTIIYPLLSTILGVLDVEVRLETESDLCFSRLFKWESTNNS